MHIPKKYVHDRLVLLLVSISAFLTFLAVAVVLLRAGIGQGIDGYIVQYRANLGLSAFQKGSIVPILSFIFFTLAVLVINILLSIRTYAVRRTLSLTVLALGILVLLLAIIVSNALLALY
ncbi:MAG TPA: hypothetical protein VFT16_01735 [Candidatus Saccharimonadales bacterium]|nr:hypothetical protein [Candidatus Saccharimonadales bacterium]